MGSSVPLFVTTWVYSLGKSFLARGKFVGFTSRFDEDQKARHLWSHELFLVDVEYFTVAVLDSSRGV